MELATVKEFCESHFIEEEEKRCRGCESCPFCITWLGECRAGRPWSWEIAEIERVVGGGKKQWA